MARSKRSEGSTGVGSEAQTAPAEVSFEAALASLEGVVARLETGDMPLEQALEAFEEGVALSRRCAATLDAAERRIEILMAERLGNDAGARVEPFEAAGAGEADFETDFSTSGRSRSGRSGSGDPTVEGDDDPDGED